MIQVLDKKNTVLSGSRSFGGAAHAQTLRSMSQGESTTQSGMPDGWVRIGLQVPIQLQKIARAEAAQIGSGGLKLVGTAAIATFLSLPDGLRRAICQEVAKQGAYDSRKIGPETATEAMRNYSNSFDADWIVTRILDPELTPPPGEKQSDKKAHKFAKLHNEDRELLRLVTERLDKLERALGDEDSTRGGRSSGAA